MDDSILKSKIVSVELCTAHKSPIIANFQNSAQHTKLINSTVKRVNDEDNKYVLIATDDSIYKSDITDIGDSSSFCNSFLAIRQKGSKEIRLIQVRETSFKHSLYDSKHSIYENNVVDAKKVLHKEFGGKKALASYERRKRTAPNVEILEETLENITIDSEKFFERDVFAKSQEEREKFQNSIFPDIDTSSGNSVRDVFTGRKLLGEEMMDHLADMSIQILNTSPKDLPFCNNFLNSTVRALQFKKNPDSKENIERISALIYADALIGLINLRQKNLGKSNVSKISDQVERDVRSKFSMQGNMQNSKFTRQKSIIYYTILMLIATEKLEIELDNLLEGIDSLSKTELLKYATVIGAKVKDKTTLHIQHAKLSQDSKLVAPMPSAKRRRK